MTPFGHLIFHFLKRMFSGEDEEGVESMSLGLGVVLAFLASPGALASLFLLDKYSTLLQFFRGQRHFDPFDVIRSQSALEQRQKRLDGIRPLPRRNERFQPHHGYGVMR